MCSDKLMDGERKGVIWSRREEFWEALDEKFKIEKAKILIIVQGSKQAGERYMTY